MNAVVPPLVEKPARARKHGARRLRVLGVSFLLLAFVCGGAFAVSRAWLFPWLGEHREWVAAELSRASGVPVSIDSLAVDWAGPRPRLRLGGLTMHAGERAVLRLERVEATVAWRSLLRWMPYFHSLEIVAPSVELGRGKDGVFTVAGIRIEPRGDGGDPLAWLFEQYSVVVRDAALVWNDELRGAPPLRLDDAQFVFNRGLVRHRFELRARPPAALATALDVSGDLSHYGSGALAEVSGRLQVGVEGADLGGWLPWVDYPFPCKGRGSVRLWLDSDGDGTINASADLSLDNVETTLAADLPPLRLNRLGGRLQWRRLPDGIGFGARSLWLDAGGGKALDPTDFDVRLRHGENATVVGGAFSASSLDLAALAALAGYLPLGKEANAYLTEFAPKGHVRELALDWEGDGAASRGWSLKANFENIGLTARGLVPGMNGVSGWIEGDGKSGRFNISSRDAYLDLPRVFENSRVPFASLEVKGGWRREDGRLAVILDNASFANSDAAGTVSGRYWPANEGGPGDIDLTGNLTRAEGGAVWRYIPLVAGQNAYNWVKSGILQANVTSVMLALKGPMRDFPFRNGRGKFLVQIEANNGRLDYAAGWPVAEDIEASLRFEGPGVTIDARQGRIFGARLEPVHVRIADFGLGVVSIKGIARGPSVDFMRYVAESPLSARLQGFPGPLRAEGDGHLNLDLTIPVRDLAATQVAGDYRFTGNRVYLGDGGLVLESAEGGLNFTDASLNIPAIRGRLLGGPFLLEGKTGAVGLELHAQGRADATAARKSMAWPLLGWLGGTADWRAEFSVGKDGHRLAVQSNLKGLHSRLPAPFAKEADSLLPLEIEAVSPGGDKPRLFTAKLGYWLNVLLVQDAAGVLRGGVGLNQPSMLPETGVDVAASFDVLDVDAWQWSLGENGGGLNLPLANVSLDARRLRAFGRAFSDLKLRMKFDDGGWRADLESVEAQGKIDWRRDDDGMLKARLRRLVLTDDAGGSDNNPPPKHLPGLDVRAERFAVAGRELGQLEVLASNQNGGWRLDSFAAYRPETQLTGSGVWRPVERRSKFDFILTTSDAGTFAGAMGYSNIVRGGKAKLAGQLEWKGAPTGIDYPTLSGLLELNVENGRFERLEPGVGRLLGILSLQALPRRVTLDFRDVFSDGFVFSTIAGKIAVSNGVMRTDKIALVGPAARVLMKGQADITTETQDLRVTVRPTLTESVAIGAAVVNPAAGAVAYLAQKVLGDPIEKMFSYDYEVTGNWVEPVVTKVGAQADKRAGAGNTETLHAVH